MILIISMDQDYIESKVNDGAHNGVQKSRWLAATPTKT